MIFPRKGQEGDCNSQTAIVMYGRGRVPIKLNLQKGKGLSKVVLSS